MHQLYIVSCTGGFYAALNSTPPSENMQDLIELESLIKRLRPGYGKHYSTVIAKCNEDGNIDESFIDTMRREADILSRFIS